MRNSPTKMMKATASLVLLSMVIFCINGDEELAVKRQSFRQFCGPDGDGDDENFCHCELIVSPLIGRPSVKIDCTTSDGVSNLTNEIFAAETLPLNTVALILSYQSFALVPSFVGNLTDLDMSNNRIALIKESNFVGISALEKLDLSYNRIATMEPKAFAALQLLHYLDLSSNLLVVVPANTFAPLSTLETLRLSSNEGFGRQMGRDKPNSTLIKLYHQLGVVSSLKNLDMERCNISTINLIPGLGLESLNLAFNEIEDFWKLELPGSIKKLELSGNPFREFKAFAFSHIHNLVELIIEDLPYVGVLEHNSLAGLPNLRRLSAEGSKNLSQFNHLTFGDGDEAQLKDLNLRGCAIHHLDSELEEIVKHLDTLQLEGNPFVCDCEAKWIREAGIETDIECYRPKELQGLKLNVVDIEDLKCSRMTGTMRKILNGFILLALLIACSLTIWCFFRQLSPSSRRRKNFQKVGPESPYQRVTIEPNRSEYSLH